MNHETARPSRNNSSVSNRQAWENLSGPSARRKEQSPRKKTLTNVLGAIAAAAALTWGAWPPSSPSREQLKNDPVVPVEITSGNGGSDASSLVGAMDKAFDEYGLNPNQATIYAETNYLTKENGGSTVVQNGQTIYVPMPGVSKQALQSMKSHPGK
jgi:hypothetical protein